MIKTILKKSLQGLIRTRINKFSDIPKLPPNQFQKILESHKEYLTPNSNKPKQITDRQLLEMLRKRYILVDAHQIEMDLLLRIRPNQLTDIQAIFIADSFNSFQLSPHALINKTFLSHLKQKISAFKYQFESQEIETLYLNTIKILSEKMTLYKQIINRNMLASVFTNFLIGKYCIFSPSDKSTILNQFEKFSLLLPQLPDSNLPNVNRIIVKYQQILKDQYLQFMKIPIQEINTNKTPHILMRVCAILGDKFRCRLNPFQQFDGFNCKSEEDLYKVLVFLNEFCSFRLVKVIDYDKMQKFNSKLCKNNLNFKSKRTAKMMEKYAQLVLSHELYDHLNAFQTFLSD